MKNKGVCDGCKYNVTDNSNNTKLLHGSCAYSQATGCSRVAYEKEHGGIKQDSCVCYEKGEFVNLVRPPKLGAYKIRWSDTR